MRTAASAAADGIACARFGACPDTAPAAHRIIIRTLGAVKQSMPKQVFAPPPTSGILRDKNGALCIATVQQGVKDFSD